MAQLSVLTPDINGETLTMVAATAGGDTILRGNASFFGLVVNNTSAAAITVTVDDPTSSGPAGAASFNPDVTIPVPAGTQVVAAIDATRHADRNTGLISLAWSAVAGVTAGVIRLR